MTVFKTLRARHNATRCVGKHAAHKQRCVRPRGHDGRHESPHGTRWEQEEVTQCPSRRSA